MTRGAFAYAQARMAARHGLRPNANTWRRLDASTSLAHFLEAARATSLKPWVERLHAGQSAHEVERSLRGDFSAHASEVATWVDEPWRPAVAWTRWLALLPFAGAWPDPKPRWAEDDAALVEVGAVLADARGTTPLERWSNAWRALWPRASPSERAGLEALGDALSAHRAEMRDADATRDGWSARRALEARALRLFRRHAEQPAAVFCHLTLTALDLERLRAALLAHALFAETKGGAPWA